LDGSGGPPVSGRAVVVEQGRIAAVVSAAEAPSGTTLRLDGLTLLPGLINMHVHLCFGGEADPATVMLREAYPMTVIKAVLRARLTVEAGVTTVRDLGGRDYAELSVRDAIRGGLIPGPRVLCAGRGICMTGGHGWNMIGRESDGPDDVRKAVREQLKAGADVIKIFATGGVMTPGVEPNSAQLTADEVRAAIEEARKAGRRTAAHAMGSDGIANCLAAGIPEYAVRKSLAVADRHLEGFRMALRAGVTIAAGTDAGTPCNPHGTLVPELALMVKGGMTPGAVVHAATAAAARVLGLEG